MRKFNANPAVLVITWVRLGILSGFLLFSGCSDMISSGKGASDDAVVALVNQEEILVKEVKRGIDSRKKQFRIGKMDELKPEENLWLRMESLNEAIRNKLLQQEAKNNNIFVTRKELEEGIKETKSGYPEDSFAKILEIEKISPQEWEKRIKINLLIKKLINEIVNSKVSVGEDELLTYFQGNEEEFYKGEQIRALHIMVETEEEARKILKKLKSKKIKFADLAIEHSIGPEGAEGGDLGYFEAGQMPLELDSIFKLDVNETSDIIRTPYGSHIFKVIDKVKARKMSFAESQNIIREKLLGKRRESAYQEWLTEIKEKAEIEIKHGVLEKIV